MKKLSLFIISLFLTTVLQADNISKLAIEMNLYAGTKASVQWERIFSSKRKIKEHGLDKLKADELKKLKEYLISHSADSKQPVIPGY